MKSIENSGRIVGVLFITVMISWTVGDALTGSILNNNEYLTLAFSNKTKILAGLLAELIVVL